MPKTIVLLTTENGEGYARRIGQCIYYLGGHYFVVKVSEMEEFFRNHRELNNTNCLVHARAANPTTNWFRMLEEKERNGFRIINNTHALRDSSDKWSSYNLFSIHGNMPRTISTTRSMINRRMLSNGISGTEVIIKPRYSQGNGEFIRKITKSAFTPNMVQGLPNELLIQEYIDIKALYRTFCIGREALNFATMDDNTDWKKSVCLNRNQKLAPSNALTRRVLSFAEHLQGILHGEINFIDIFVKQNDELSLSEVNTACNLNIHENLSKVSISSHIAEYLVRAAE